MFVNTSQAYWDKSFKRNATGLRGREVYLRCRSYFVKAKVLTQVDARGKLKVNGYDRFEALAEALPFLRDGGQPKSVESA